MDPRILRIVRTVRAVLIAAAALVACGAGSVRAQESPPAREAGSDLVVYHAVFGPGDAVWEKFGHNALWIHDASTGSTISYNYGMFDFSQAGFIPRLMRGDMLYSMGVRDADDELAVYSWHDRSVTIQRLDLTPAQRHALREFLEWNWLPENRDYLYDYFRDNCSTRIRDAIDHALGGDLADTLTGVPTGTSYRSHSLRLTASSHATFTGLLLGLGSPTDRPIDAWQEGFVPMELMRHLRTVHITDATGSSRPLVAEERVLFAARRAPPPDEPPGRTPAYLAAGVIIAAAVLALGHFARRGRRATLGLAAALSLWGVVHGFFGLILFLLWTATNHTATYMNINLLHVSPVGFVLAFAAPLALLRRTTGRQYRSAALAWPAAAAMAAMSGLGVLLNLLPPFQQVNAPLVALVLPVHLVVVLTLYRVLPRNSSSAGDAGGRLELNTAG